MTRPDAPCPACGDPGCRGACEAPLPGDDPPPSPEEEEKLRQEEADVHLTAGPDEYPW